MFATQTVASDVKWGSKAALHAARDFIAGLYYGEAGLLSIELHPFRSDLDQWSLQDLRTAGLSLPALAAIMERELKDEGSAESPFDLFVDTYLSDSDTRAADVAAIYGGRAPDSDAIGAWVGLVQLASADALRKWGNTHSAGSERSLTTLLRLTAHGFHLIGALYHFGVPPALLRSQFGAAAIAQTCIAYKIGPGSLLKAGGILRDDSAAANVFFKELLGIVPGLGRVHLGTCLSAEQPWLFSAIPGSDDKEQLPSAVVDYVTEFMAPTAGTSFVSPSRSMDRTAAPHRYQPTTVPPDRL